MQELDGKNNYTKEELIEIVKELSLMNLSAIQEKMEGIETSINKKIEELVNKSYKESAIEIIEKLKEEQQAEERKKYDRRLRNARYLFNNFHNLQTHYNQAVYVENEIEKEKINDIFDFIDEDDEITMIQAIYRTKRRTKVMLDHITVCVNTYIKDCRESKKANRQIEADIIEKAILKNMDNQDIADEIGYNARSVYRIKNKIIDEELSILLFGIDAIRLDKENLKKKK